MEKTTISLNVPTRNKLKKIVKKSKKNKLRRNRLKNYEHLIITLLKESKRFR